MRTTHSSSRHGGVSTPPGQIPLNFPLGCGPGPDPPQLPPWVWAWSRPPLGPGTPHARFIRTDCMRRIRWSCEGLTSVHNEYTGYLLKHLLLRHMYNLPLLVLMCYAQALRSETSYCYCYCCSDVCPVTDCVCVWLSRTVLCGALYTACVDASRTVFWDRSVLR